MVTAAPPPEMAIEKVKESKAGADGRKAEKDGSAEPGSSARRGKRRRSTRGSPPSVERFFLTRNGNGIPELAEEVEDENTAMVEALKTEGTYIILSEWRSTVDNTTKGSPVVTKEAISKGK